jgi:hypothetical protein
MAKKKPTKKKTTKRGVIGSTTDETTDPEFGIEEGEGEEGEGEEGEGTLHVFEGEPLPVKVGDTFSLASNPGIQDEVTPELLEDLIRRNKALPLEEEGLEDIGDPDDPDTITQHEAQEAETPDRGRSSRYSGD